MKIETIEIELGVVQNIGDYSNVRPTMKLVATLDESEDVYEASTNLRNIVTEYVQSMVDDEMEAAGRPVKYSNEMLFRVERSDTRRCVVIAPATSQLPSESNWKERDSWVRDYDAPHAMRLPLANKVAADMARRNEDCTIVPCLTGDFDNLPPLPDPGPEPLWSQKEIGSRLRNWGVDESEWEDIASLEWVDLEYLGRVANHVWGKEERLAIVRENLPLPIDEPEDDDDYDDDHDDEDVEF